MEILILIEVISTLAAISVKNESNLENIISIMDKGYLNIPKSLYDFGLINLKKLGRVLSKLILYVPIVNLIYALCYSFITEMQVNKKLMDINRLNEFSKMNRYQVEYYGKLLTNREKINFYNKLYDERIKALEAHDLLEEETDKELTKNGCLGLYYKILDNANSSEILEIAKMFNMPFIYGSVLDRDIAIIGDPEVNIDTVKFGFENEAAQFLRFDKTDEINSKKFDVYILDYELLYDDDLKEYCLEKKKEHKESTEPKIVPLRCNLGSFFTIDDVNELSKIINATSKVGVIKDKLIALIGFNEDRIDNVVIKTDDLNIVYKYREALKDDLIGKSMTVFLADENNFLNREFIKCYIKICKNNLGDKTDLGDVLDKPKTRVKKLERGDK